jgi:hypothetical protein
MTGKQNAFFRLFLSKVKKKKYKKWLSSISQVVTYEDLTQ